MSRSPTPQLSHSHPLARIPGAIPDMIQAASAFFLSRTGSHLYLRDKRPESRRPLVYDLATPEYTAAVAMFQNVDIYANAVRLF